MLALSTTIGQLSADAPTLFEQGRQAFERGDFSQAIQHWQQALVHLPRQRPTATEFQTSIALAGAYQAIGHQRKAARILEESLASAEPHGNREWQTRLQIRLGGALVMILELDRAAALLGEALDSARAEHQPELEAEALNELGNLFTTQEKHPEALAAYQSAADLAQNTNNSRLIAQVLCNAAAAAARAGDSALADALNAQALLAIDNLEPSHTRAFLLLAVGQNDRRLAQDDSATAQQHLLRAHDSFTRALAQAEQFDDRSIQTYALGYLAQLYDTDQQADAALDLARRAAFVAQQAQMPEALYRWEWHIGRLLRAQGSVEPAIAAYRRAVRAMEPIRNDVSLGYGNARTQRPFRETEGPLFLELADLLLERARATPDAALEQSLLLEARDTVEYLKAVELEDYFCDDCVDVQRARTRSIEAVDPQTAVIYLIPLPTRTEVLVGFASGVEQFSVPVGAETLTSQVRQFRRNLETRTTFAYLEQAQQLYDWLIRPFRGQLDQRGIQTLVFVPDGALRTIPFASLHNGERFLIEELAVAVAPGLSLVEPRTLEQHRARLLLSGLSDPVQGFPPLEHVPRELESLEPLFPSQTLFNRAFTLAEFNRLLTEEQFSIIHIASHGQFDRDVRNTFVLTYDDKLTLNHLETLIRPSRYRGRPVELLVLSACQTAAGDDRAALGLAGVAVKAGARSALATLWFVSDQSTSALVTQVYKALEGSPGLSKARALQLAQVSLLGDRRYRHPCYWAPYLIIGNWL